MANRIELNAIFRLRRDNDYNYEKVADRFIPERGEVCLVDTVNTGLRAKIGDGISTFRQLNYVDENIGFNLIVRGYFSDKQFYLDSALTILAEKSLNKIYIDVAKSKVYYFDGNNYISINDTVAMATPTTAGVMKLYDTIGQNTDGTMTQKAITDELDDKVEINTEVVDETLHFII